MPADYKAKINKLLLEKGNAFLPNNFVASKLNVPEILIGREKEKKIIADNINEILRKEGSKIIRIFGSAGVGKSSIILYLREVSRNEEFKELLINVDDFESIPYIYLIYIQMESRVPTGGLVLKFFKHIYNEFGGDGFFIELAHKLVGRILGEIYEIDFRSKKKIEEEFSKREIHNFKDPDDFEDMIVDKIKYRTINKIITRNYKKIDNIYLKNLDQGFINLMCEIINPDRLFQEEALRRLSESAEMGKYGINDDISAMEILSNIISAIKFINKFSCIIIAIDHLETYTRGSKHDNMDEIFKLIMGFRNKISNNLLLILISTIQGYKDLLKGLRSSTGDINQLFLGWDGGEHNIEPIDTKEFIKVIKHYWEKALYKDHIIVLPEEQFYPFCIEGLEFLYEKITLKNIRASFNLIKSTLDDFRNKNQVQDLTTRAKMVSKFDIHKHPIDRIAYMFDEICSNFFNLNSIASKLEKSLELNIRKLKNIKKYPILTVSSNKKVSVLRRKPDVFIQFGKNNEESAVEIQVKAYNKSELSLTELESSIELLENGITDYCLVLVTKNIKPILVQQLKPYEGNLGFLLLDMEELQAYLAIFIEEIRNEFFENWELNREDIIALFEKINLNLEDLYEKSKKAREGKHFKRSDVEKKAIDENISKFIDKISQLGEKRIEELNTHGINTLKDLADLDNDKIQNLIENKVGARISKTLLLKWQIVAEEIIKTEILKEDTTKIQEGLIFSTKEQHFLREYKELGLQEIELDWLEKRGILTIEEILEPNEVLLKLRKPKEIDDNKFSDITKRAQELLNFMKFE